MFNAERMLGQMLSGALGGAMGGGSRRRRGGSMLSGAAKAQIGVGLLGVAMAAWEHYKQSDAPAARAEPGNAASTTAGIAAVPPPPPPPMPEMTRAAPMMDVRQQQAALLIRAMVAAAAADGEIDADERAGIIDRARVLGDEPEALAFLEAEMRHPLRISELAAQAPSSLRQDVYAAAILAIEVDSEHEKRWLADLASALKIEQSERAAIHQQLGLSA
ncbi:DUF533 domain-containing protein [Pseudomarimonas arenosa]|uniref:DUF533 domain-containing protein n=1 Tax=Pseudomarimonas arenosa TaxID=2774145 RepID=A0AAW3ZPQ6_9GAMM|nr:DUF533 domain-containing protein [Pseudomarimonas arenosa]MBD8526597.1 DUF533 domain-containing protein [Pseudomarimonas arenosa]